MQTYVHITLYACRHKVMAIKCSYGRMCPRDAARGSVTRYSTQPIKHSTTSYYVNEGRGRCAWQRHPTNEHNITIKQAMGFDTRKHPPLTRCARTHGKNLNSKPYTSEYSRPVPRDTRSYRSLRLPTPTLLLAWKTYELK